MWTPFTARLIRLSTWVANPSSLLLIMLARYISISRIKISSQSWTFTHAKVLAHWPVAPSGEPVGLALDAQKGRLFIGCRKPQMMIVMSTKDGKVLASLPIGAGVDATKLDSGEAFASCRDGSLIVAAEKPPGKFEIVQTVKTRVGARTMSVDSSTHTIYLPTAEFEPTEPGERRPKTKPGTFMIVVVAPSGRR